MAHPLPYKTFACRIGEHQSCEFTAHDEYCGPYCVLHCTCDHHPARERERADETADQNR